MIHLLIDKTELKLLLEKRKAYIGTAKDGIWETIFASVTFLFSLLYTECSDIGFVKGDVIKFAFLLFTFAFLGRGMSSMIRKKDYSAEKLYDEVVNLNRIEHPFSIIGVKDSYNEFSNRYLLYYDTRWKCFLFPNIRTSENDSKNEENMIYDISNSLKIKTGQLSVKKVGEKIHQKYSVSDEKMKWYHHTFYEVNVQIFPEEVKKPQFNIDGKNYCWMSIAEMENNSRIQEVNSDIVSMVKELYH